MESSKIVIFKVTDFYFASSPDSIDENIYWGSQGTSRSYLKFEPFPDLDPKNIAKAEFVFFINEFSGSKGDQEIAAYKIIENWYDKKLTFKNRPCVEGCPVGKVTVFESAARYVIDVTSLVKDWAESKQCYGIMLGPKGEVGIKVAGMYSAKFRHPHIRITLI